MNGMGVIYKYFLNSSLQYNTVMRRWLNSIIFGGERYRVTFPVEELLLSCDLTPVTTGGPGIISKIHPPYRTHCRYEK